jgi:predicted PurR-regulated permease PerM
MFILLEYRYFKEKLQLMINNNIRKNEILVILDKIKRDTKSYFVIKTGVSFITAFISYIIMISFWLDFAIFWAFLIFCLNFIPSIWSVIAVSFPIVLSLLQFNNLFVVTIMWLLLVFIQILMWNIIEPKFMWNKLNLSPLVIIVSLTFWWSIWWLAWMILAVPIMVIINIILAKIPSTKNLAILLSEKWELEVDGGESILKTRRKLFKYMKDLIKKYNKTF